MPSQNSRLLLKHMLKKFLESKDEWILLGYFVDIRYIAVAIDGKYFLTDAHIYLSPISPTTGGYFEIVTDKICIGRKQLSFNKKSDYDSLISNAIDGFIVVNNRTMILPGDDSLSHYSEMARRDAWELQLHLKIGRNQFPPIQSAELIEFDNILRLSTPPFDGLTDVASILNLRMPGGYADPPAINISVGPPVDLRLIECNLNNDKLYLSLVTHSAFDISKLSLLIRAMPDSDLSLRMHVTNQIRWAEVQGDTRKGYAEIELPGAHGALVTVMNGTMLVRRQWFLDGARTSNRRLLALETFDSDKQNMHSAIFTTQDSATFEKGIANLMFVLGFSVTSLINKDAPDLVLATPQGKLIVLESTLRTSDFANKIGKLYDRKRALSKKLQQNNSPDIVYSILVCALPKDQIVTNADDIKVSDTILLAREDLIEATNRMKTLNDPDSFIEMAQQRASYGLTISENNKML
ncbi:hypothetical protein ACO0LD_31385 [Undibacterium sp. Ji83W]|uniref:hypothetical protein n=1 Tax=Undibacterium sp. Ji83W TaxID=3413043 RepID=UPI003BF30A57